jgi:hypothetical protein
VTSGIQNQIPKIDYFAPMNGATLDQNQIQKIDYFAPMNGATLEQLKTNKESEMIELLKAKGLQITPELLAQLKAKGIKITRKLLQQLAQTEGKVIAEVFVELLGGCTLPQGCAPIVGQEVRH